MRKIRLYLALSLFFLTVGCGPKAGSLEATETSIAAKIYATLTAVAPTITPEPSMTPVPPATATSLPTVQPTVQAKIVAVQLNLREGPGTDYPILSSLVTGDVVQVTGQYASCDWLQVQLTGAQTGAGWIKTGDTFTEFDADCNALAPGLFRPLNGQEVYAPQALNGLGTLAVANQAGDDGVVVLATMQETAIRAMYVRSGDKGTLTAIPDGIYKVFFTTGQNWDWTRLVFTNGAAYKRRTEPLSFVTTDGTGAAYQVSIQNGADGGTDVQVDHFPPIK
jgi:hypothetical protein